MSVFCLIVNGCRAQSASLSSTNNEGTTTIGKNNDNTTSTTINETAANETATNESTASDITTTSTIKDTRPKTAEGQIDIAKLWEITPEELLAKPDDEFMKISSEKFIHEFMDDKVAADNKYTYRYLEVNGKVDGIKRDGDSYLIIVYANDQENNVYCWINNKEEADRVEALNLKANGDEVTIRGIVNFSAVEEGYMHVALGSSALKEYSKK